MERSQLPVIIARGGWHAIIREGRGGGHFTAEGISTQFRPSWLDKHSYEKIRTFLKRTREAAQHHYRWFQRLVGLPGTAPVPRMSFQLPLTAENHHFQAGIIPPTVRILRSGWWSGIKGCVPIPNL